MPPVIVTINKCALVVVFLGGLIVCERANTRMLERKRDSGYRYWLINPMALFAGFSAHDFMLFVMGMVTMGLSFLGLKALG